MQSVSVIFTVLNEGRSIGALLDTLAAQTRKPDQVVVCDGGSSDDTLAQLRAEHALGRLNLRVIEAPGANISRGRNTAIAAATGPLIACCDAGVRLDADWLEHLIAPFATPGVQAAAGFFLPDPRNAFEVAMGATVLPRLNEINPAHFLPSSRSVAFTKDAWHKTGGYPEWLDFCEDLVFDFAINKHAGGFVFAPRAVAHFRPRGSLRSFYKQYFLYARGDGKANLWLKRHLIRYATYVLGAPLLIGLLLSPLALPGVLGMLLGAYVYLRQPYLRLQHMPLWPQLGLVDKIKAVMWVPVIRVWGDVAKMIGYPVGVVTHGAVGGRFAIRE